MTVAQCKARRHYWTKVDKRYLGRKTNLAASRRREEVRRSLEKVREARSGKKGKKRAS